MATRAEREREKKASLLAAAEEVFTSKGYTDATLDEIIKLADTGKGTVYRYFGNKENLFYQLVLGKHQALMEDLWALARRESCGVPERMRLLSRRWLRFLTENKVLWPVVGNEMAGMNKGVVGDRQPDGTYRQYVRWGPMPSPEKSPRVSPEQGGPPLAMPNQNFPNKKFPAGTTDRYQRGIFVFRKFCFC